MEREQTTTPLTTKSDAEAKGIHPGPPKWRSSRFILAYMIMLGNATVFFQRVTFSMAVVCMVNHTAIRPHASPPTISLQPPSRHGNGSSEQGAHSRNGSYRGVTVVTSDGNQTSMTQTFSPKFVTSHFHQSRLDGGGGFETGGALKEDGGGERTSGSPRSWHGAPQGSRGGEEGVAVGDWGQSDGQQAEGGEADQCQRGNAGPGGTEDKEDGPFVWDKETQGLLLGAVYWGYMTCQILAAYFIYYFGPRRVCMVSVLAMSVLTMLCHPAAHWSPWAVFTLRVLIGVCTSFSIPGMYAIWGKWAPVGERATLVSLSFSGQNIANAVAFPTAALLCKYGFLKGWPSVFYVYGLLGVAWCVAWLLVVSDSPEVMNRIHPAERDFILANRGSSYSPGEKIGVPWCKILGSTCFWAIAVAHFSFTWGLFLFMSNLPLYMYEVMKFDIKSNGVYSMLPYIALGFVQMLSGFVSDVIVKKQILGVFWARRLFCCLSNLVPAVCVVVMSFLDCRHVAAVMSLLVAAVGFTGFAFAAFLVNPYDIAPRYAVSIAAITNSLACIPGVLTPYLVAEVTKDQTREQWQIIFFITAAIFVAGALFFCIFAKTTPQPWGAPPAHVMKVKEINRCENQEITENGNQTALLPETEALRDPTEVSDLDSRQIHEETEALCEQTNKTFDDGTAEK